MVFLFTFSQVDKVKKNNDFKNTYKISFSV